MVVIENRHKTGSGAQIIQRYVLRLQLAIGLESESMQRSNPGRCFFKHFATTRNQPFCRILGKIFNYFAYPLCLNISILAHSSGNNTFTSTYKFFQCAYGDMLISRKLRNPL